MDVVGISGKLIRPDGREEYWWNGVNYQNMIPEELIDAVVASKNKKDGGKNNDYSTEKQKGVLETIQGHD